MQSCYMHEKIGIFFMVHSSVSKREREREEDTQDYAEISHHVANYADYKSLSGILLHKNGR